MGGTMITRGADFEDRERLAGHVMFHVDAALFATLPEERP
jgi:hypothetical protein